MLYSMSPLRVDRKMYSDHIQVELGIRGYHFEPGIDVLEYGYGLIDFLTKRVQMGYL